MENTKTTITIRIPTTLNEKFTKCAMERGLTKNSLLITFIEEIVRKHQSVKVSDSL